MLVIDNDDDIPVSWRRFDAMTHPLQEGGRHVGIASTFVMDVESRTVVTARRSGNCRFACRRVATGLASKSIFPMTGALARSAEEDYQLVRAVRFGPILRSILFGISRRLQCSVCCQALTKSILHTLAHNLLTPFVEVKALRKKVRKHGGKHFSGPGEIKGYLLCTVDVQVLRQVQYKVNKVQLVLLPIDVIHRDCALWSN